MNRLEHQIVRDLRQIADRATPSPNRWNSILTRIAAQDPDTETEPEQQLVPVKEIYVSVDSPPTSETRNRRRLTMAVAAVVAVVGVAAIATNSMNSDDGVEPAPAAATTVAPTTVAPRREAGTFEGGKRVTYTVPDGWETISGGPGTLSQNATGTECRPDCMGVVKGDPAIGVVFMGALYPLYTHYCRGTLADQVGPYIDDLVSAWTNLPGVDATAARDVTVDGFDAKEIELTVSAEAMNRRDCSGIFYRCSYSDPGNLLNANQCKNELAGRANQELKIWILDIDHERHMIVAGYFPDTSQQDRAALDEIVASIQIG